MADVPAMPIARGKFVRANQLHHNLLPNNVFCKTSTAGTRPAYFGLNTAAIMNILHALGFFILGLTMAILPELAPAFVPANATFGDVTALWLEFMGGVLFLVGSGYMAKCIAAALPKPGPVEKAPAAAPAHAGANAQSTIASTANRAAI
jgi:hypothetical protein